MDINVFLLCYNERVLLPHAIHHFKTYIPSCKITICDNESTDDSVELAKSLGCAVIPFSSKNISDETVKIEVRNTIWSDISSGWIIMADMDEFLCVTEAQLLEEMNAGVSILKTVGKEMIGESETLDLSDIDLQAIKKYVNNPMESKYICFLRDKITQMNYGPGSHTCKPVGVVKYSTTVYMNKHMSNLGLNFITDKTVKRYHRTHLNRQRKWSTHYTNNVEVIKKRYLDMLNKCNLLE